ncbi:TPA: hypothetical protein QCJ95_004873 [Enterobacter asburiae]|nr:hypothetical protein [Enterobacter asburiae]HDR2801647.1 hypothetical protein [Enterobacter asburiae]
MKLTLKEMNGLLNGKFLPSDLLTSETLADYLFRKFDEAQQQLEESHRALRAETTAHESTQMQLEKMAAENAGLKDFVKTCFRAAADGVSLDGADIQELGERLGLFGREAYQPALHGYICGHEAGEDTVYVMKKTPATDAFMDEVQAQGVEMFGEVTIKIGEEEDDENIVYAGKQALLFAAQLRKGAQS